MKGFAILVITVLFYNHSPAQSLEGEWRGTYKYETPGKKPVSFALHFSRNKDSTYKIYSYTLTWDPGSEVAVTLVSEVACRVISPDSIYLEEGRQVKPKTMVPGCSQKFFLAIKKKNGKMTLDGIWSIIDVPNCGNGSGTVFLTKK